MSWLNDEPVRGGYPQADALGHTGLDQMRSIFRNQMPRPPIHHLFGLEPVTSGAASTTFSMPASPWLASMPGPYFPGTAALVADAPLGSAILAVLGHGKISVTSDISFNFLRPMSVESGYLNCRARPIEVGSRLGLAEGMVEDGRGRAVAHCTTRCFILPIDVPAATEDLPEIKEPTYDTPDPYQRPVPQVELPQDLWDRPFLDVIAMIDSGELEQPPFAQLFGISDFGGEPGTFFSTMPATAWHTSPSGTVYGGVIAFFADTVLTGAFSTMLSPDEITAALDLRVQFLRPVHPDGRKLTARAEVVHRGRSFITAEVKMTNEDDKLVAFGTSSAAIIKGRSWSSFAVTDEAPTDAV
jgi:uncharacterized protein (TIGR00369 family)